MEMPPSVRWLNDLFTSSSRTVFQIICGLPACKGTVARLCSGLYSQVTSDRTRGHSLQLHQGRVRLDIRKNFFMERVVRQWKGLPSEVLESPSMELFRKGALGALIQLARW